MIKIIDTFKTYQHLITSDQPQTIQERLDVWEKYIKQYPELEKKFKDDYTQDGIDWQVFAKTKVFNHQGDDYPKMLTAYDHLKKATEKIIHNIEALYGLAFDINILYYSGLCNSAGWVDKYQNTLTILLGIDKIAELSWHEMQDIETLLAHEFCHALHFNYRQIDLMDPEFSGDKYHEGIWYLYEEGLATHFQKTLTEHTTDTRGNDWLSSCRLKEKSLKDAYKLALEDQEIGTRDFYGDWWKVQGLSDVGYYLGSVLIDELNQTMTLEEISRMSKTEIITSVTNFLDQ